MRVVAAVALSALVLAGCSKVIDESSIPVVTVPSDAASPSTSPNGQASPDTLDPTQPLQLGSVSIDPCTDVRGAWCGAIDVPLDRADPDGDQIAVGFEVHPRADATAPSAGTIVAIEGGPGFASTGSRDSFLGLFAPIMDDHDLLLVDDRGTGRSSPLDCPALQRGDVSLGAADACMAKLGKTADEYGAAAVADDLADVLDTIGVGHIELYGDSYGTFVAQVFAARHGDKLASLVLDSAFPLVGSDPFHADRVPAMLRSFDLVCARSVACAAKGTPTSARIFTLLASLRTSPVNVDTIDADGNAVSVSANPSSLLTLTLSAAYDWTVYRELDAATTSWLTGDRLPLLRLLTHDAATTSVDSLASYSAGVAIAATCSDYSTVFDPEAAQTDRLSEIDRAVSGQQQRRPDTFTPWTADEWRSSAANELDQCATWPAPDRLDTPVGVTPDFPDVPTLVLAGDLDTLTPPSEGAATAALFPNASFVTIANTTHVTALDDSWGCASRIVTDFVESGAVGDTSCTETIPEIRTVDVFPMRAIDATPAFAVPGDASTGADRQIASVAAGQVGDSLAQWANMLGDTGRGLRGGEFHIDAGGASINFTYDDAAFADDVTVTGTASTDAVTGHVTAEIDVTSGVTTGRLTIEWDPGIVEATASVQGVIGGRALSATLPAP